MTKLARTTLSAFCLACTAVAAQAQTLPIPGAYLSADQQYVFEIASANPNDGAIQGTYIARSSPVGYFNTSGHVGQYGWVYSTSQGRVGVAPFLIQFNAIRRPDSLAYALQDTWTGVYQGDDTILAAGTRAYVDSNGVTQVVPLGEQVFTLKH